MRLDDAVAEFLRHKLAAGLSERTVAWYGDMLRAFVVFLQRAGANGSNWLHGGTIDAFLASERERVSASTVAARYRALRPFFAWLETSYGVPSPMKGRRPPKVPKAQPRRTEQDQAVRLLDSIALGDWVDLRDRLLIHVLAYCGLRASEALALALADFHLQQQVLVVTAGKGGDARPVPFVPAVGDALRAYLLLHPSAPGAILFPGASGGGLTPTVQPLGTSGLRAMLQRRCRAAGIEPYLNPHSFRHGLAIRLLNAGADMSLVQAVLGHSRIGTTEAFYAKWVVSGLRAQYLEVMGRGT